MNKFYIVFALVVVLVQADDEPFSIGLGVLSPSYTQTVGKENVKVNFEQKDNGFSYSVGDPSTGTNTYLNFGPSAAGQAINPAGYADVNPAGYAGANPSGYAGVNPSGYAGVNPAGYAGANPAGYAGVNSAGYGGVNPAGYAGANPTGYSGVNPSPYAGASGFGAPQVNPGGYNNFAGYQGPSYGASSGLGAPGYGSQSSFGGSAGLAGSYNGQSASPNAYLDESARKPEEASSQILPAGFSYHGTEGQSFLRQDSPDFMISDQHKDTSRGLAEQSFQDNKAATQPQGSGGKFLVNGLVGYGAGGPRGGLPVGGYAGPQFAGLVKENAGHNE